MNRAAEELNTAMSGWGTDEAAIQRVLAGRSPSEAQAIRATYRQRYGTSLDAALSDELSGDDLRSTRAALSGSSVNVAVAQLQNAAGGLGTDEAAIHGVLDRATPEQRRAIAAEYQRQTGTSLDAMLQDELAGTEAAQLSTQGAAIGSVSPTGAPLRRVGEAPPGATTGTATAATAAPGQPEPATAPDPAAMRQAAADLFQAMDGWGTNEGAVQNALRGRAPAEIAAIRAAYQDHYGTSLDAALGDELSGTELEAARAALSGNRAEAAAARLINASSGLGTDEEEIQRTLEAITDPEERRQVAAAYRDRTGQSLDAMLEDEMGGNDLRIAQAYSQGDRAAATAARLDAAMNDGFFGTGLGTDEDAVYSALESAGTPAERAAIAEAYQRQTGRTLDADLGAELSGGESDVASALREGDRARAAAARMSVASDGLGTDEDGIFAQLEGRSPRERRAIIAAYNERYGNFDSMLRDEMGEMDAERATQLAEHGHLDPVFALRYAMDGLGTDEGMIRRSLEGRSREEIEQIQREYQERYGVSLQAELDDENSGRDGFEIGQLMLGEPRTPEERIQRSMAAYDFERGSGAGAISNFLVDMVSDSGEVMDRNHQELVALQGRLQAGTATPEDMQRLETVTDYHRQDVQAYQAARDSVANGAAIAGTVVVGTVASILTAGSATPAVAAAISALLGAGGGMAMKYGVQGASYSNEDIATDAAMGLVSAATAGTLQLGQAQTLLRGLVGVAPGAETSLMQTIQLEALQGGLGGLASGTAQGLMDERTWRGPGNGLANFFSVAGSATLSGTASGAASGATSFGMDRLSIANTWDPRAFGALSGAVSSSAGGVAQTLADPASYAGGFDDFAQRFASNVGQNAIQGAGGGYASGVGKITEQRGIVDTSPPTDPLGHNPPPPDHAPPPPGATAAAHPAEPTATASAVHSEVTQQVVEAAQPGDVARVMERVPEVAAPLAATEPEVVASAVAADPRAMAAVVHAGPEATAQVAEVAPPTVHDAVSSALTPDQQAVVALRADARTAADWEAIRSMEREVGLPESPLDAHASEVVGGASEVVEGARGRPAGASFVDSIDPAAETAYQRIRAHPGDVTTIAENTGLLSSTVERIKNHLFNNEHTLTTVEGEAATQSRFVAIQEYADLWTGAERGTLTAEQTEQLMNLMTHENVEARLAESGLNILEPVDPETGMRPFRAQSAHDLASIAERNFDPRLFDRIPPEVRSQYLRTMIEGVMDVRGTLSPEALEVMPAEVQEMAAQIARERAAGQPPRSEDAP